MTNEEAFEKWAIDYGLDYEPSFTRYDVEASWQAAIAYMQGRNESVMGAATLRPLKRLDDEIIEDIQHKCGSSSDFFYDFANAIMDEMEKINK